MLDAMLDFVQAKSQCCQLGTFVEELRVDVVDKVDAIAVNREDLASDGRVVVEVQQESHGVVAGEVVFQKEVCPDDWGCGIRDSDIPFIFAIAEADGHVPGSIAGDSRTIGRLGV